MYPDKIIEEFSNWLNETVTWTLGHVTTLPIIAQILAILIIFLLAYSAHRKLRIQLDSWVRSTNLPGVLRSISIAIIPQVGGLTFIILTWIVAGVFEKIPEIATSGLMEVIASLVTAWVIITISSLVVANHMLARFVAISAWSIAALNILGLLTPTINTLRGFTFSMGSAKVSLLDLLGGIVLLIILVWIALAITRAIDRRLAGMVGITPRARVLIIKLSRSTLVVVAVLVALPTMGLNFGALAVFSGALGVGVGIGLQKQVSNLLSGVSLLLDKSIKPGDVIEVGQTFGWVREMTARYVGVITRDNKEILIPNDDFVVNQVINWSHSDRKVRMEIKFGVSYNSDPHSVRRLAVMAAKTPERVANAPEPMCHVIAFGDSSIDFVLRFWINDPEEGVTNVKGHVFLALWDLLKENGIEIPFPHRQVILDQAALDGLSNRSSST